MDERNDRKVGGIALPLDGAGNADVEALLGRLVQRILALSPTEFDLYRYLVEEADRFAEGSEAARAVFSTLGFDPLEYEGESARAARYGENRVALRYLEGEVSPDLIRLFGETQAEEFRALLFMTFVSRNAATVQALRLKYAAQSHNNCISQGHFTDAARWSRLIDEIAKEA